MPIYDFYCKECGTFELLRPIGDSGSPATCPECNVEARRTYSMPAFKSLSEGQKELRRREERSGEPTISTKPPSGNGQDGAKLTKVHGRPWQIGH